jgi:hypothetical protein
MTTEQFDKAVRENIAKAILMVDAEFNDLADAYRADNTSHYTDWMKRLASSSIKLREKLGQAELITILDHVNWVGSNVNDTEMFRALNLSAN